MDELVLLYRHLQMMAQEEGEACDQAVVEGHKGDARDCRGAMWAFRLSAQWLKVALKKQGVAVEQELGVTEESAAGGCRKRREFFGAWGETSSRRRTTDG